MLSLAVTESLLRYCTARINNTQKNFQSNYFRVLGLRWASGLAWSTTLDRAWINLAKSCRPRAKSYYTCESRPSATISHGYTSCNLMKTRTSVRISKQIHHDGTRKPSPKSAGQHRTVSSPGNTCYLSVDWTTRISTQMLCNAVWLISDHCSHQ